MGGSRIGLSFVGLLVAVLVGAVGCGAGGTDSGTIAATPATAAAPRKVAAKPKLTPAEEASVRAEGRRACSGKAPLQVARLYLRPARKAGITRTFGLAVAHPAASTQSSSGYPRLVAALYARTVPFRESAAAAAGCTEELVAREAGGGTGSEGTR